MEHYNEAAQRIFEAYENQEYCAPVRDLIGDRAEAGYVVQAINTKRWLKAGRRIVGYKIGLTSTAVQIQLGVDQPDFGVLFDDMKLEDGAEIAFSRMHQPKAEGEIAFVLGKDLCDADITFDVFLNAVEYACPAIEIVGSRIKDWDIKIADTIADNASCGLFVMGQPTRSLKNLDLEKVSMVLKRNGKPVSFGTGAACLGHPVNAAVWLAKKYADIGSSLKAGDIVLSGALGPMATVDVGDAFKLVVSELGSVGFTVVDS